MIRINSEGYLSASGGVLVEEWQGQMFKPRYNFTEKTWFETATEDEITEINSPSKKTPTKTNQELQEEVENLKAQLEAVHERLCTQQEMSATVIASVFGNEVLKNE